MRKSLFVLLSVLLFSTVLFAKTGAELAKEFKLNPSSKAIVQWERVFENPKRLERMGVDKLSPEDQKTLKEYLIKYAADSDQPAAAGL